MTGDFREISNAKGFINAEGRHISRMSPNKVRLKKVYSVFVRRGFRTLSAPTREVLGQPSADAKQNRVRR